ncbi:uncharacterized protein F4822DRAFT_432396 [Hypoxylon trugodes]|uniref:uncharacterized protein n=1 Tax=Hypoxylon trugodes TaxID=326681 RepID=UPI00219868C3|nr:uncharacterized protein F4822DRAFT_432396 [Hypoxylon trugodes]KAI1385543.1 hypothetical protein F4822DRAFT_432396 [Hypoxylon trugodes]
MDLVNQKNEEWQGRTLSQPAGGNTHLLPPARPQFDPQLCTDSLEGLGYNYGATDSLWAVPCPDYMGTQLDPRITLNNFQERPDRTTSQDARVGIWFTEIQHETNDQPLASAATPRQPKEPQYSTRIEENLPQTQAQAVMASTAYTTYSEFPGGLPVNNVPHVLDYCGEPINWDDSIRGTMVHLQEMEEYFRNDTKRRIAQMKGSL